VSMNAPGCPECAAWREVIWGSGSPPYGPESWECGECGHEWQTPPVREQPRAAGGSGG